MKNRKKNKKENGQAMIEFAFVLPIFLLLVMGILDFGFLFYNYISLENSARNAARIACVEYTDVSYNKEDKVVVNRNMDLSHLSDYTVSEQEICNTVKDTLPAGVSEDSVKIKVVYTYDHDAIQDGTFNVTNRWNGDVKVTVTGNATVLTPILGATADNMKKKLSVTSTYKTEKQYVTTTTSPY